VNPPHRSEGPRWLRGDAAVEGPLFGGCLEVLEFLKGTRFWPPPEAWRGRVLFLETSEAAPSPVQVRWALRNYGLMGVFDEIAALLVGRAARYPEARKRELDAVVTEVVADEFHHPELAVVTDLDFGHTDPQWVLPLGVRCRVDPIGKSLRLTEPWLKVPA
jgi:muramoyltetrapeptide carboxypeptidase LdcA involved in peptidoglycan recycling